MHVPNNARQHIQRQAPPELPTIAGVSGLATASAGGASASSLITNGNPTSVPSSAGTAPAIVPGSSTLVITSSGAPTTTTTSGSTASQSAGGSSDSHQIPIGNVIGACVGAFAGCCLLILLGWLFYKRTTRKVKRSRGGKGIAGSPLSETRNIQGNVERRRSKLEPWNKLGEKEIDVWEGMIPSPQTDNKVTFPPPARAPTPGKLGTMFKSSPSIRSTDEKSFSSESHGQHDFGSTLAGSASFAKYHPHLAEELAKTVTPTRANVGREDAGPPISWDGETVGDEEETFLSLRSGRIDSSHLSTASEALSPTVVKVSSTPTATSSEPHLWESAEVMHYDNEYFAHDNDREENQNPFSDESSSERRSVHNPFFNAQDQIIVAKRRPSIPTNPFTDPSRPSLSSSSRPMTHVTQDSTDRAMQSLIAALNVSPEEVQERLRVASMQSMATSAFSSGSALEDDTSVAEFPLPPTQVPRG